MAKNKDTRPVATDALETLGTLDLGDGAGRDAIHLAVEPVTAHETLHAGQHVGFTDGRVSASAKVKVGIVDPFIKETVYPGSTFWLVLYPRTITSLRHVWSHPAFPEESSAKEAPVATIDPSVRAKAIAEEWIRSYCSGIPLDYETMMSYAESWVESQEAGEWGDYLSMGGLLEGEYVPDEFWNQYEIIMDVKVPTAHRGSFFSCSC